MGDSIINKVGNYYSKKVMEHGATSTGVDWNGRESQFLRFQQLGKVLSTKSDISILDYGCGYGAFIDYLAENGYHDIKYFGYDISEEMLKEAKLNYPGERFKFINSESHLTNVDFTIASGIFNVRLDTSIEEWEAYILKTLDVINRISDKGFSFNILTSYSDEAYKKDYLFYAEPMFYFNLCKEHYSRNVALLHDYDLYEFTIIVRK